MLVNGRGDLAPTITDSFTYMSTRNKLRYYKLNCESPKRFELRWVTLRKFCQGRFLVLVYCHRNILEFHAQPNLQKLSYSRFLLAAMLFLVYNNVDYNATSINVKKIPAWILKVQPVCLG